MTISVRGVIFGSRLPRYGVNFARRFTSVSQTCSLISCPHLWELESGSPRNLKQVYGS